MDATVSELSSPRTGFAALSIGRKLMLAVGLAALVAVVVAAVIVSRTPDYKVLFANLSDKDGGAVIASLSQMNVPYKFSEIGGAILVPADRVHDARLKLASQGLPRGGTIGFELMETQKFGTTQFQERLNFQRALEGELARSIQSLAAVQSARVHLALPAASGFLREQQKPSASVLLALHPGRVLDRGQVAGILHLVASSIPEMSPQQVSVVDQNGELLSNSAGAQAGGLDPAQIGYVRTLETSLSQRIVDILEPIVGPGNVRAQVSAEVDFTQTESTAEQYRPNQGNEPAAVRSQQSSEANSRDAAGTAGGIPGAMSNQPPPQATAPINGPAQQTQAAGQNGANSAANTNARRDTVTNYEVDKTVRVTRNATGNIKRLSAAVVVNHRRTVDEQGKASLVALQSGELENLNALVKQAIGLNQERGDSLNVVNAPFTQIDPPKEPEIPLWKQPENISLAKEVGKQAGLVLLGLIIIFMVIRPALKAMNARPPAPPAGKLERTVANDVALPPPTADGTPAAGNGHEDILKLARDNPATVANVVRTWVNKEAST